MFENYPGKEGFTSVLKLLHKSEMKRPSSMNGNWIKSEVIGSKRLYSPVPSQAEQPNEAADQLGSSFPIDELLDSDDGKSLTIPTTVMEPIKHESVIVNNRLGFDEAAFRQRMHQQQAELSSEFKQCVEALYDAMDGMVAEVSRQMYQQQQEHSRELESLIGDIKQATLQTGILISFDFRIFGSFHRAIRLHGSASLLPDPRPFDKEEGLNNGENNVHNYKKEFNA